MSHRQPKRRLSRDSSSSCPTTVDNDTASESSNSSEVEDGLHVPLKATPKFESPLDTVFQTALRDHRHVPDLLFACLSNDREAVRRILDVTAVDKSWFSDLIRMLIMTTRLGHVHALEGLVDVFSRTVHINFNPPAPDLSLLEHAVMAQDWSLSNVLLTIAEKDESIDLTRILSTRKTSKDLLTLATTNGDVYSGEQYQLIERMIHLGARCSPKVVDHGEGYPLTNVAKAGSKLLVKLLLKKKASLKPKTASSLDYQSPRWAVSRKIAQLEAIRGLIVSAKPRKRQRCR